jgi:hypothetical protein
MNRKIPPEAVTYYYGLGPGRSYEKVAAHYGVSKRAVVDLAKRENWQAAVEELDRKARERAEQKVLETNDEMNERQLKVFRYIQSRAIETLKALPLETAVEAVKAYTTAAEKERLIRGEPTDRTAINLEEIVKSEYRRLMRPDNGEDEWADLLGGDAGSAPPKPEGEATGDEGTADGEAG